jgi:4-amino-4-deoxy-L-arabinose transferase-like glycosyltransferase
MPLSPKATRWMLLGVIAVSIALRIGLGIWLGLAKPPEPGSDREEYDTYAWNLVQGRGYRGMSPDVTDQDHLTAYRPPVTSLTWAGVYAVVGRRYDAIRLLNCAFGVATVWLVFVLGKKVHGDAVGLIAAAGYAVYPHALFYSVELLSEAESTFLFLAYLIVCLDFARRPTWGLAVLAGVISGVGMLCRPAQMFMIPLTVVWALWQFRGDPKAILKSFAIPVVAAACLVPWVVRNYQVFHAIIPFSTMGQSVLLQGNNRIVYDDPEYWGYNVWDTDIPEYKEALAAPNDEVLRDKEAGRLAKEWILANKEKLPIMVYWKWKRGLTPFLQPQSPRIFRLATLLSWGPVLLLSAVALIPTLVDQLKRREPGWILHLGIVHYLITTALFFGYARYRHPIEPICLILGAVAIVAAARWARPGPDAGPTATANA